MNKKMLTAPIVAALLAFGGLSAGTMASAATYAYDVGISDGNSIPGSALYTEAAWQTIVIPLSAVGGVFPSTNLTLQTSGLPAGVTIALTGSSEDNGNLILAVDTERTNTSIPVNTLATVTVLSGSTALTSFQVPVVGAAVDSN